MIDVLGAASPHDAYLAPFFVAFVAVLTPTRVLIGWVAARTNSIPLAQLIRTSLTGSLAMLSSAPIPPAQEALWYAIFAAALWLPVIGILGVSAVFRPADVRWVGWQFARGSTRPRASGGRNPVSERSG
ncbi:MAG: hypothetical protein ACRDHX_06200 [Chloroflexota bacterium]